MLRQMANPSPVPRTLRVRTELACSNLSKMRSRSASAMASPLFQQVRTANPGTPAGRCSSSSMCPERGGQNLMALVSRLLSTCVRRIGSQTSLTGAAGARASMRIAFSLAAAAYRSTALRTRASSPETSKSMRSLPPANFERSSRSSTIALSRSVDSLAIERKRRCFSLISPARLASTRSTEPLIAVSGVRSSWLTMLTNSSLRSSSRFCSVMSRRTTTTPASELSRSVTGETVECRVRSKICTSSRSVCAPPYSQPRTSSKG